MDAAFIIVGVIVLAVAAGFIGWKQGVDGSSATVSVPPVNSDLTQCSDTCNQLDRERQASCLATAALAAANARLTALIAELAIAAAAAVAAWVAVAVASAQPIYGWIAAAALALVAAALTIVSGYLTGQLVAAQSDLSAKQAAANEAMSNVVAARNLVLSACTGQALTDCLSRPSPCA
jgi:hypothetical protein